MSSGMHKNRPARRVAQAGLAIGLLLAQLGCGGGGGGGDAGGGNGGGGPAPSGSRMARIVYDFDANGVADAVETLGYDSAGRPISSTYSYSGDGTADLWNAMGTAATTEGFSYTADGKLAGLDSRDPSGRVQINFAYDGNTVPLRADLLFDGSAVGQWVFTYGGGLLTRMDTVAQGQNIGYNLYEYNAAGLRTLDSEYSPGSSQPARTVYDWHPDGSLAEVRRDLDADGSNVRYTLSYSGGRQTGTVKTVGGLPAYSVSFVHDASGRLSEMRFDLGSNGSVDAIWTAQWESGACAAVTMPVYDPLIDSVSGLASPRGQFNQCAP